MPEIDCPIRLIQKRQIDWGTIANALRAGDSVRIPLEKNHKTQRAKISNALMRKGITKVSIRIWYAPTGLNYANADNYDCMIVTTSPAVMG